MIFEAGESNGNETTEAKGRVKILRCEGDVTPQSRAECTVSLKNQMSVKLTGWRKMGKVSPAGIYAATMLQDRGNRRADDGSGSRWKSSEFGCRHTEVGNRVSSRLTSQPATKDSNRLVWNSGDPTDWNSQVIVIAIIDSTPQGLGLTSRRSWGTVLFGDDGPMQKDEQRGRDCSTG